MSDETSQIAKDALVAFTDTDGAEQTGTVVSYSSGIYKINTEGETIVEVAEDKVTALKEIGVSNRLFCHGDGHVFR